MAEELLGCLEDQAIYCRATGSLALAAKLAATASMLRGRLRLARTPRREKRWQTQLEVLSQSMPTEAFETALAQGVEWTVEQAVSTALAAPDGTPPK